MTYTINPDGGVIRDDGAFIPKDPRNIDWLDFLDWRAAGNSPAFPPPPVFSPDLVKAECSRRIYAEASDNAQKNMLANYVAGNLTTEEQAAFKEGTDWIGAMQLTCRTLIEGADWDYALDSKWPAVPPAAKNLAARF